MVQNVRILKAIIIVIFVSFLVCDYTNTAHVNSSMCQSAEKNKQPSFMEKIKTFFVENKQICAGLFVLTLIAPFYPKRPPLFVEWALMNLIVQMFGGTSHVSVHYNAVTSTPYYIYPRSSWWF